MQCLSMRPAAIVAGDSRIAPASRQALWISGRQLEGDALKSW
jgi:hypothetical protein